MSYVPNHLEFLSRSGTADGWPAGITEVGKEFATKRIIAGLEKYGQLTLDLAKRCIFDHYIDREPVPEELNGVAWDWLYGVTHRALLAASGRQVWVAEQVPGKKTKTTKEWHPVAVSRADVEALEAVLTVPGLRPTARDRVRELADVLGKLVK
jgi:uncharacterized RmlC-like cupin family protein